MSYPYRTDRTPVSGISRCGRRTDAEVLNPNLFDTFLYSIYWSAFIFDKPDHRRFYKYLGPFGKKYMGTGITTWRPSDLEKAPCLSLVSYSAWHAFCSWAWAWGCCLWWCHFFPIRGSYDVCKMLNVVMTIFLFFAGRSQSSLKFYCRAIETCSGLEEGAGVTMRHIILPPWHFWCASI